MRMPVSASLRTISHSANVTLFFVVITRRFSNDNVCFFLTKSAHTFGEWHLFLFRSPDHKEHAKWMQRPWTLGFTYERIGKGLNLTAFFKHGSCIFFDFSKLEDFHVQAGGVGDWDTSRGLHIKYRFRTCKPFSLADAHHSHYFCTCPPVLGVLCKNYAIHRM